MRVKVSYNVTLDVIVDSAWEDTCTIQQVKEQSLEAAKNKLNKLLYTKDITNITIELKEIQ